MAELPRHRRFPVRQSGAAARAVARLPYGASTKPIEEFDYEEAPLDAAGAAKPVNHEHYCWMNAAYVLGTRLTDAFAQYRLLRRHPRRARAAARSKTCRSTSSPATTATPTLKCPTEIGITDRREFGLSNLGFLPLCHYKNTDYAVFFGAQSTQKPKKYDRPEATANAAISARLPYMMATSRIRPLPESHGPRQDRQFHGGGGLSNAGSNRWIQNYVNSSELPVRR